MSLTAFFPLGASASVFSAIGTRVAEANTVGDTASAGLSSENMALANTSTIGPGTLSGSVTGGIDASTVITDAALTPTMGPVGNASDAADLEDATGGYITFYTVRSGDSIGSVSTMFGITPGTLRSANGLKAGAALGVGQKLVILPVSGTAYSIKSGDTIKKIAQATKTDTSDLYFYNDLTPESVLSIGDTIIIPDSSFDGTDDAPVKAVPVAPAKKPAPAPSSGKTGKGGAGSNGTSSGKVPMTADGLYTTNKNGTNNTPITVHPAKLASVLNLTGRLVLPVDPSVGRLSQGLHKTNAVDIAAPLGTPIHAVADGTVLLARTGGYNGGFGNYVILLSIIDGQEVESIYGHQAKLTVSAGQHVSAGQVIGYVGRTGDATGNHLHIEIRGGNNPFVSAYRRQ